jgi:fibronectin type 3 domain-containing protein
MRRIALFLTLTLCGPLFAQQPLTFDPANPPTQLTPPTEIYHHWVDTSVPSWNAANTTHQKGPKTVLVIRVRPSDAPEWTDPPTYESLINGLQDSSQRYYSSSYHQTWFGPKRFNGHDIPMLEVTPVLTLPENADFYRGAFGLLQQHSLAAVRALGGQWNGGSLDPNNFDRWVPMSNVKMISSTGLAYVGGRFAWMGNTLSGGVALHEWGHNWGVFHANGWEIEDGDHPRSPNGWNSEYQDGWCVMGGNSAGVMFNPMFRRQLKFLEESRGEVVPVTSSGTHRIYNYVHSDRRQTASLVRALRIPMLSSGWNGEIILGFGHTNGTDGGFGRSDYNRNAVTVHARLSNGSNRIDTTPGSRPGAADRNDSSIKIGRTYSEPAGLNNNADGFHITPVLRGSTEVNGQTHEWIEVVINYDSQIQNNQPPTASFPTTLITDALPGVPYTLTVTASDPNGDTLAFDWDFGDDTYNILNSGTQTKTWDSEGVYLVRATVSDMKGGTATAFVWVNVGNIPFRAPETPAATISGLQYTYYHGTFNQLPVWGNLLPVKQGTVDSFSLSPRERNREYAFVFEGYVDVPVSDVYAFTMASRDGSRLFIGDTLLIGNDGLRSLAAPVTGNIALNAGKHPIRVEMFNRDGNGVLNVEWSTLSMESAPIPASALFRNDPALVTPPTVSITYPETGAITIVGSDMTILANAGSPSAIDRVVFFIGSAYLGEASSVPYSVEWMNLPVGTFFITAVAYDTQGDFTVSDPVLVNVVSPEQRDSIGINFLGTEAAVGTLAATDQAGAFFLQANWNNAPMGTFSLDDPGHWDYTLTGLKDRDGVITGSWTRYRSRRHQNHGHPGDSLVDTSTPNGRLMRSGLKVRGDTAGPIVEVYGIPYESYDVYVYFDPHEENGLDASPSEYVLIPQGQSPLPSIWGQNSLVSGDGVGDFPNYDTWVGFQEATAASASAPVAERLGNYVVFRNVSAPMFRLESRNMGSVINAVQIVSTFQNNSAPSIYAQPQSLSLPETRTAAFTVRYVGHPAPAVEWFRVGHGSLGVFSDTLVLENITPADAGGYYAVVHNSEGTDTSSTATLTVTAPPSAPPSDLMASSLSTSEIGLTWTDNASDEDGFMIYRASTQEGPWVFVATVGEDVTEYVDAGLPEATTFYYRVSSFNDNGESNPSNVAFETTQTSPRSVTILQQPVSIGVSVGQTATLTVEADAYPAPEFQWRKNGVVIEGATGSSLVIENTQFSDDGIYTVLVYNQQSEEESVAAVIAVSPPLAFGINTLHVINEGSVSENNGVFSMTRSGTDEFQGVAANFPEVPLEEVGDYIELQFTLRSNTSNNSGRTISFGFFQGPVLSGNGQTGLSSQWQGYVHQPGSRSNDSAISFGMARQGAGPLNLMDVTGGGGSLDGVQHATNMPPFHQDVHTPVTLRLERISSSQIRLRSVYNTPAIDRSGSGTNNGIVWSFSSPNNVATVNSTFAVADGPVTFNGFAIATRGNWVLQNLSLDTNVDLEEPPPPPPAPENLTALAISGTQIDLSWTDPTDPLDPPDGFRVERSADGSSGWTLLETVEETEYSDTSVTAGSTWSYRVIAVRGGIQSAASDVASASTPEDPVAPQIVTQPESQTVGEGGTATFTVVATGNPAPTFQWRKGGIDLDGEQNAMLVLNDVTEADAGDYTVFVSNGIGDGVESDVATLTVTPPPPPAPTGLTATAVSFEQIDLVWSDGSDGSDPSDQFRIERSSNGSAWSTLITVSTPTHSDTGLSGGSTWYYRVIAVRDGLESEPSVSANAITPAQPVAPSITQQPQSQTVFEGATVTFSVTATGEPAPQYQWRKDGVDLQGETDSTLTLTTVSPADEGTYTVYVYNDSGNVISTGAVLAVMESAGLLVYESFDYSGTHHLNNVPASGEGLSGNWTQRHTGAGESQIVDGLEFGPLVVSGNAFQLLGDRLTSSNDRFNVASVEISATTSADTVWSSHLVEFRVRDEELGNNSSNPESRWQDMVAVHGEQLDRTDQPRFGFSATRDGSTSQGRVFLASSNTGGNGSIPFHQTHMIIGKVTGLHQSGSVTKTATMWVLNLSDFEAFVAAGRTEAALEENHRYTVTRTVTNETNLAFAGRLNIHTLDWNHRNFFPVYDEIRFGTDLQSVTPVTTTAPVPPPAPEGLLAVAVSSTRIELQWSDASDSSDPADEFRVERSMNGQAWETAATVETLDYSDSSLEAHTWYHYRVIALRGGEESEPSGSVSARTWTVHEFPDESGDGVDDVWMAEHFDGFEADDEILRGNTTMTIREIFIAGLDPADSNQVFKLDGMSLSTVPNRWYQFQRRDSLTEGEWEDDGPPIEGNGNNITIEPGPGFYRVRVMLAP